MLSLVVDDRELILAEKLEVFPINLQIKRLTCGDVVCGNVVIERKTREDFEQSILDRRLFKQLEMMSRMYERKVVIVEGEQCAGIVRREALMGAYASIVTDYGAGLFFTKNIETTAELIFSIAKHVGMEKSPPSMVQKLPSWTPSEHMRAVVELFPLIGPKTARTLLSHFGSIYEIVNASEEELRKIEGIGKKRAHVIHSFLRAHYKPEEDAWMRRDGEISDKT